MNEQSVVEVRNAGAMLKPFAILEKALYEHPTQQEQTMTDVRSVRALLKMFFMDERIAYQAHSTRAKFDRNARKARAISHRVLATLVPAYRRLDKFLMQPNAGAMYDFAPRALASVLVFNFICTTRFPDTHPVWQLEITAQQVKALVEVEPLVTESWYASQEEKHPGITQVLNGNAATLRELRTAYLSNGALTEAAEQKRLRKLMAYLKNTLKPADYALLSNNMKAPV